MRSRGRARFRRIELEGWKRVFLETGTRGLKTRAEPEERDLTPRPGEDRGIDDAARAGRAPHRKKLA
jgi:hypothetical protein